MAKKKAPIDISNDIENACAADLKEIIKNQKYTWYEPNTTQVPNYMIDRLMPILNLFELKFLLFLVRQEMRIHSVDYEGLFDYEKVCDILHFHYLELEAAVENLITLRVIKRQGKGLFINFD